MARLILTHTQKSCFSEDFRPQTAATSGEIQDLVRYQAYWLGFRHNPHPGYPIDLDSPIDLEYLGVTSVDVRRYVLLLEQRGLLEKIVEGVGRPTHKLIEVVESASKTRKDAHSIFARMAIEEAKRSVPEQDRRIHPKVGVVIVKDGRVLAKAHRGEFPEGHAEFLSHFFRIADVWLTNSSKLLAIRLEGMRYLVKEVVLPAPFKSHDFVGSPQRLLNRSFDSPNP